MRSIDIYSVGSSVTISVKIGAGNVKEYIQCVVKEHVDIDPFGNLVSVRVNQIINLSKYLEGNDTGNFVERTLRTRDIEFVNFIQV